MKLKETYAKSSDDIKEKEGKVVLSDDAYAICDFIEQLINKVEHARMSLFFRR